MKYFIYIMMMILVACKGQRAVQVVNLPDSTLMPLWLQERPVSSSDYVGIGLGNKRGTDYQETAKKNALNDLASEISVTIEGNSLLYTLDRRYKFEEEFTATIQATTSELLEGYELVDSWANDKEYWVYYRLNKAKHAELKAVRKERAIASAKDLHRRAEESLKAGNIREAFEGNVRALLAMKDHWNEEDKTEFEGENILLGNHLYSRLQDLAANIKVNTLPARVVLDLTNGFQKEVRLEATYVDTELNVGLNQLPLLIESPRNGRIHRMRKTTGQDGETFFWVKDVDLEEKHEVCLTVDMEAMIGTEIDDPFVSPLLNSLTAVTAHVPVEFQLPTIFMKANERNYDRPLEVLGIASVLRQELTERGFVFTSEHNADLHLTLNANTRKGNVLKDFHTAYLDLEIVFEKVTSGEVIHHTAEKNIKGVQLNWRKAGEEAFRKGGEELKKRIMADLIDSLL